MYRFVTFGIGLLLVFMPLPLGGLIDWSKSVLIIAVAILFSLFYVSKSFREDSVSGWEKQWLLVWVITSLYILFQLTPIPFLSPKSWCPFCDTALIDSGYLTSRITFYPLKTITYWAMFSAYWIVMYIVILLPKKCCLTLIKFIVVCAIFQSLYGLVAFSQGQESILGIWEKERSFGAVSGSFYNPNHLAGLLVLCLPIGVAYFSSKTKSGLNFTRAGTTSQDAAFSIAVIVYVLSLTMTVFATNSRLGTIAMIVSMVCYFWFSSYSLPKLARKDQKLKLFVFILLIIIAAIWFGVAGSVEKFIMAPDELHRRTDTWKALLDFPNQVWIFGIGAGAFEDVYRIVQPAHQLKTYLRAHSDLIQFILEFGLVGAAIISVAFFIWINKFELTNSSNIHFALLAGMIGVIFQSLADFDFQIPGVAFGFWVCLGLFLNPSMRNIS